MFFCRTEKNKKSQKNKILNSEDDNVCKYVLYFYYNICELHNIYVASPKYIKIQIYDKRITLLMKQSSNFRTIYF